MTQLKISSKFKWSFLLVNNSNYPINPLRSICEIQYSMNLLDVIDDNRSLQRWFRDIIGTCTFVKTHELHVKVTLEKLQILVFYKVYYLSPDAEADVDAIGDLMGTQPA